MVICFLLDSKKSEMMQKIILQFKHGLNLVDSLPIFKYQPRLWSLIMGTTPTLPPISFGNVLNTKMYSECLAYLMYSIYKKGLTTKRKDLSTSSLT